MHCNCAMMSLSDTLLVEEEGVERDGAKQERRISKSDCRDLNCASLRLMVAASIAHMIEKWSEKGKGTEKWHRIRVIAEGKMGLSRVAISLYTFKIERIKCEGKSIVRCSNKESKNRA